MAGTVVLDQIEWPQTPALGDEAAWARNVATVKMLCELGVVTGWINGVAGRTYTHMPYHYEINGIVIQFLPHWGFLKVGRLNIDVPSNKEDLLKAVEAVKVLNKLGLKPQ